MSGPAPRSSLPSRLGTAWQSFWHAEGSTLALGVFRILFAYCLFREVGTSLDHNGFAIEGGYHVPYVSFLGSVSESTFGLLHDLQYPFILLLAIGALTRVSCVALLALQGFVFFADVLNFRNHPYFFLLVLLVLLFSPADESLSLRSLRGMWRERGFRMAALVGHERPLTFQRLIQVQVCIAYFFAALHKMHPYYLQGEVLARLMQSNLLKGSSNSLLANFLDGAAMLQLETWVRDPDHMVLPALLTVSFELLLPFALWFRRSRPCAILAGIAFHVSIAWLMDIRTFSLAMVATYLLFLDPRTLPAWLRSLRLPARRARTYSTHLSSHSPSSAR